MKRFILTLCMFTTFYSYSQIFPKKPVASIADIGLGISKIRNGYMLYTDFSGTPYLNQDEKLCYSPLYSIRGKITDGNFKYRLFLNFASDKKNNIIHDTAAYIHTTSFNFRGLYPRLGFERMLWSKYVELRLGVDFLYIYELYDVNSYAKGCFIPNLPLESYSTSKHTTNAWGVSPLLSLGFSIKNIIFLSVESGIYLAYGKTKSHYTNKTTNLNNNHKNEIEDEGSPSDYYRFDNNNYLQFSIDYRFNKKH